MERQRQRERLTSAVFDCLSDRRRRCTLSILHTRVDELSESDLATAVAAEEQGKPLVEVDRSEHDRVLASIRHTHLPALGDAGLIERDTSSGTLRATDHHALRDEGLQRLLEGALEADPQLEAVFEALASDRRRRVLALLREADGPLARHRLAERLARRETDDPTGTVEDETVERVRDTLYHVHLPKLEAVGLVERPGDVGASAGAGEAEAPEPVAFSELPSVEETWLAPAN